MKSLYVYPLAAASTVALALGACSPQLDKAENLQQSQQTQMPAGTPFTQSLGRYYLQTAQNPSTHDTEHFAVKAQATMKGQVVAPDTHEQVGAPDSERAELAQARTRLTAALNRDAAAKAPDRTAQAQVSYDCWLDEAGAGDKARTCRDNFYAAMANVDQATKLVGDYVQRDKFVVYFDNDSATISPQGMDALRQAAASAREDHVVHVTITGGADRTGSARHNQVLSEKRAKEVRRILVRNGVSRDLIIAEGRGVNDPQVVTAEGVASPENRNVIVTLERK